MTVLALHLRRVLTLCALCLFSQPLHSLELRDDAFYTGLSLSPDGRKVVIGSAKGDRNGGEGQLNLLSLEDRMTTVVPAPPGILPFNPEFGPDGRKISYAGICVLDSSCNGLSEGWNLFVVDLETGETTQKTDPKPGYIRWRSIFGPNEILYYTEFRDRGAPRNEELFSHNSIYRVGQDGQAEKYFPINGTKNNYQASGSPKSVRLLHANQHELIFYGRVSTPTKYPEAWIQRRIDEGVELDVRMQEFVRREIYEDLGAHPGKKDSASLFKITATSLDYLFDRDDLVVDFPDAEIPNLLRFINAASDGDEIWAVTSSLYKIEDSFLRIRGVTRELVPQNQFWGDFHLDDFDVAGSVGVAWISEVVKAARPTEFTHHLRVYSNWELDWELSLRD